MLLTIKKEIEETIAVETPAYFKDNVTHYLYRISEYEIMQVGDNLIAITRKGEEKFESNVAKVIEFLPSTEAEFTNTLNAILTTINILTNYATAI